jgi:ParB/RepB/Spo0J family partition protein
MTTYLEQSLIEPNPYQPRLDMDPVALNRLAEDIQTNGLLQAPAVRPIMGGRYQIIFGHRRAAAWKIAHGDSPLPCDIREMDDRQMFAAAIVENDDRENLNAIERAKALQLYMTKFDATQAAAATLFGLKDQASVSNLLRLLRLPAGVQAHVATGDLPERYAREMIPLATLVPENKLIELANRISTAQTPGDASAYLDSGLVDLLNKYAPRLNVHPQVFTLDWDPAVSVDVGGTPMQLPKCTGCKFLHKRRYTDYCLRPACYSAKAELFSQQQAREVAAKFKATIAETGKPLVGDPKTSFSGDTADLLATALKQKHAGILLLSVAPQGGNGDYWRRQITGSDCVDITLADGHTLESIAKDLGKKKPATAKSQQATAKKVAEKESVLRDGFDKLMKNTKATVLEMLPYFRSTLTLTPAIGARLIDRDTYAIGELFGKKHREDLEKNLKANKATQPQIVDSLIGTLLWDIADNVGPSWFRDYKPECNQQVRDALADFAHQCKVKLPAGWDARLNGSVEIKQAKPKRK